MRLTDARKIDAIYDILVKYAGASPSEDSRVGFILAVTRNGDSPHFEYRFGGKLGFGGKFRISRNRIYVDCYPEHENVETLAIIEQTNADLAALRDA